MRGVILYGPPAAGKDTVTAALSALDPNYRHFRRVKVGGGRSTGYRMSDESHVAALRTRGDIVWENRRYGALYVVDRPGLRADLVESVPVVHVGQVGAVEAIRSQTPEAHWTPVYLWCPRPTAKQRMIDRGDDDVPERLCVWDSTPPLAAQGVVRIDTSTSTPEQTARHIHAYALDVAATDPTLEP
jgi:guanylate kinase